VSVVGVRPSARPAAGQWWPEYALGLAERAAQ
jgi:hypothetical protein